MDITPQDTPESQKSAALVPDVMLENDEDHEILQLYASNVATLTTIQQMILVKLVQNMGAEVRQTDGDIALKLGIARTTIVRARQNPKFQAALAVISRDAIRGLHDKMIGSIYKHGDKDWGALKFLLQYDGSYVPTQQNLNVNASIGRQLDAQGSITDSKDALLTRMGELGWSMDRVQEFAASFPARFEELRAEGAF